MAKGRLQENHSRPGEQPDQISTGQKALGGRCPEKNVNDYLICLTSWKVGVIVKDSEIFICYNRKLIAKCPTKG